MIPFFYVRDVPIRNDDKFLMEKYENIVKLINKSMSVVRHLRPTSDKLLAKKNKWAYNFGDLKIKDIDIFKNKNFIFNFLKSKAKKYSSI